MEVLSSIEFIGIQKFFMMNVQDNLLWICPIANNQYIYSRPRKGVLNFGQVLLRSSNEKYARRIKRLLEVFVYFFFIFRSQRNKCLLHEVLLFSKPQKIHTFLGMTATFTYDIIKYIFKKCHRKTIRPQMIFVHFVKIKFLPIDFYILFTCLNSELPY